MTVAYESAVVKAIRGFKAELRAHEGVQINLMANRYLDVERALESNIAALSEQITRLASEGMEPSWSQLYRLERWQTLQLQTMEELARFNGWAVDVIKAEQLDMMTRGIDNASAALESMKPGLGQFTKMPHDALQGMVGIARDGSPLGDLLASSYPAMRDSMTRELVKSVALGRNPRVTAAAVRKATGMGLDRALNIARTEQLRVYREATRESYVTAGVRMYQRIASLDERTCCGCAVADGEILSTEAEFDEHCQGRCFVSGTVAAGPPVGAATSRKYVGEVVTVGTASGNLVTVTPNHAILTDRGWIAAGLLREGDNVVSSGGSERVASPVDPHEYQVPTRIEDVRRALGMNRIVTVPAAAENFHGDGRGGKCEVYVVGADRLLGDSLESLLAEVGSELNLGRGNVQAHPLARQGTPALLLHRLLAAPEILLHQLAQSGALLGRQPLAAEAIGGGLSAPLYAGLAQMHLDSAARDPEGIGKRLLRFSGEVASRNFGVRQAEPGAMLRGPLADSESVAILATAKQPASLEQIREGLLRSVPAGRDVLRTLASNVVLDHVLDVSGRRFSGHVYNLQTQGHWYSANSIIAHNCDLLPIVVGVENPQAQSYQDWYGRQDEATQRSILGPGRYDALKSGSASWKDLGTHTHSDQWGGSYVATPVSNLPAVTAVAA